ncbi:MFS transporter [Streptomyces sp. NPDC059740]|uniref:MFS transporter n=1 Tax=Streptomyces sp. NPDC059740 TaxID=3346926 RepID=UPI003651E08D
MASATTRSRPGYVRLLRTPGAWTFLLPGFLARQPFAMLTIGILLLVQHTTGSYGDAGTVSAVTGVAMALAAPRCGRLADRFGQRAVLVPCVLLHAAAVSALVVLALAHLPLWLLVVVAVCAGATTPQVGPMVRARWATRLSGGELAATAAAFESVTDEFTFVVGPVVVTALCTGLHPAAGLTAELVLTVLGGLLFASRHDSQPPVRTTSGGQRSAASALAVPGVRVLAVAFLGIGAVFGGMQVSLTAFTDEIGQPGLNGLLYGVFATGNMLAGAACGALPRRGGDVRRMLMAYTVLVVTLTPLWALGSPALLASVSVLIGLGLAPGLVTGYALVERLVPASARTEAFTWLTGAVGLGQAAAATITGRLVDRYEAHSGFLVPLGGTLAALVVLVALRDRLRSRTAGRIAAAGGSRTGAGERQAAGAAPSEGSCVPMADGPVDAEDDPHPPEDGVADAEAPRQV